MKIMGIIKAFAVASILLLIFLAPSVGYSGDNVKKECTVTSTKDSNDVKGSLRRAVHWFNKTGELQACRNKITFKTGLDSITLRKPLVISGPNGSSSAGEFVFGPESGMQTLYVSNDTFDGEDDTTCAIKISTSGARIRNIRLLGNKAKSAGICLESGVILENVEINEFVGDGVVVSSAMGGVALDKVTIRGVTGSAITISEGVGQVAILPNVTITGVPQAVTFKNGGAMSSSTIISTNRREGDPAVLDSGLANFLSADFYTSNDIIKAALGISLASTEVPTVEGEEIAADEETGTIVPTEQNFIFSGITGDVKKGIAFVDSNGNTTVQIWKVQRVTGKTYIVKGAVVEYDPHAIPDAKNDEGFCGAPNARDLYRLHIYSVKGSTATFVNYVMEMAEKDAGGWTKYGIKTSESNAGEFVFELDASASNATSIIIVPEFKSRPMGAASELIPLVQDKSFSCPAKAAAGGNWAPSESTNADGSTTGFAGYGAGDDLWQYSSLPGCFNDAAGFTQNIPPPDPTFDTDGDGIPDYQEMSMYKSSWKKGATIADVTGTEFSCDCSKTLTCWYNKDTDGDGIPDKAELTEDDGVTIRASDNDGLIDALDVDSDGDTLADGIEDRFRTYKSSGIALLYDDNSTLNQNMPFGNGVTCQLNVLKGMAQGVNVLMPGFGAPETIGISYGLYIIETQADGTQSAKLYSPGMARPVGSYLKRLQCRDFRTFGETSFNGKFDIGYDRSDLTVYTSDPKIDYSICQPNELLMSIPYEWFDVAGQLKDEDKNSVPDLFEKKNADGSWDWQVVQNVCTDVDSDGIPDCVKRWDGQCPNMTTSQKVLDPYKDDYDGDGVKDKDDVCPFTKGSSGQDIYGKNKLLTEYSCSDPRKVFVDYPVKIITCFIDRDGDQLRDCEEDKDVNGEITPLIEGKDGVALNETDPLMTDTDDDGLTDREEVKLSGTNPRVSDSDYDGLNDAEEIKHGQPTQFEKTTLAQEGCLAPLGKAQLADTDPWDPDTDLDKIMDGVEVNVTHTNPNNGDSDKDTIKDGVEDENQNGIWPEFEGGKVKNLNNGGVDFVKDFRNTNPCLSDTDGDGFDDNDPSEDYQCAVTPTRDCKSDPNSGGMDSDADGLDDYHEAIMKTDPYNKDTDGDHVLDGAEIWYQIANNEYAETFQPQYGESDPNKCILEEADADMYATAVVGGVKVLFNMTLVGSQAGGTNNFCKLQVGPGCGTDSDGDCMPDNAEYTYGTNPGIVDSDGDGVIDGVEAGWCVAEVVDLTNGIYRLRPNTGQYTYQQGSGFSNATNSDTDGDLLADGQGAGDLYYEDKNCNGRVDFSMTGVPLETDKLNANTDGDKWNDKAEFCRNGICGSQQNLAAAFTPMGPGCAVVAKGGETWGMTLMFVMMLGATRVAVYVMRRTKKAKARG